MLVLMGLAQRSGDVVERITLLDEIWNDDEAADDSLTRAISLLRKAFRELDEEPYIETIPKRGYRLIPTPGAVQDAVFSNHLPNTVAVLPFADLSPEQNQSYFADGMAEEILNTLTRMPNIAVVGRTSSFAVDVAGSSVQEIGAALNAGYLLEGSLRSDEHKVRITARLIEVSGGRQIWSDSFDGAINEIFEFQDVIARTISRELAQLLGASAPVMPTAKFTHNPEAYALFLQGRELVHKLNGQTTIPSGIRLLEQAVTVDPEFTDAFAWLALAHFILPEFSRTQSWEQHFELSGRALDRALLLDPDCSMALLVKALRTAYQGDMDKALIVYEQALRLDPNNVETMAGYGLGLMSIGLHEKARPYWERIIEKDPLCGIWHTTYGGLLLMAGQFEQAEAAFRRSFELGFGAAAFGVSHRMAERGETDAAIAFMEKNFDGLPPIEQAELRWGWMRKLIYNAYLRKAPLSKRIVGSALKSRLRNRRAQPTAASAIGFLFLGDSASYMRNISEKPNPYIGYTIARIWEPTAESRRIREHPNFREFAEGLGLVRAWNRLGWPTNTTPWQPIMPTADISPSAGDVLSGTSMARRELT